MLSNPVPSMGFAIEVIFQILFHMIAPFISLEFDE